MESPLLRWLISSRSINKYGWLPQAILVFNWSMANQKQELPVAAMFVHGFGRNEQSL
jgi:hypothetical protein